MTLFVRERVMKRTIRTAFFVLSLLLMNTPGAGAEIIGTLHGEPLEVQELPKLIRLGTASSEVAWDYVVGTVTEAEIERLELQIYAEDLDAKNAAEKLLSGLNDEMAEKIVEKATAAKKGLEAWLENPEDDTEIYRRILEPTGCTWAEWESMKKYQGTPEEVQKLDPPENVNEVLARDRERTRRELLRKMLAERFLGIEIESAGGTWQAYLADFGVEADSEVASKLRYPFIQQEVSKALNYWVANLLDSGELTIDIGTPGEDSLGEKLEPIRTKLTEARNEEGPTDGAPGDNRDEGPQRDLASGERTDIDGGEEAAAWSTRSTGEPLGDDASLDDAADHSRFAIVGAVVLVMFLVVGTALAFRVRRKG